MKLTTGGATITTETDDPRFPTYYRITTAGQVLGRLGRDVSLDLSDGKFLSFWVRADANLGKLQVGLGTKNNSATDAYIWPQGTGANPPGTYTSGAGVAFMGTQNIDPDEWRLMIVTANTATCFIAGTPDPQDVRTLYMQVTPVTGTDTSVDIADVRVHDPGDWPTDGTVVFMQDDGYASWHDVALPALSAVGWRGNVAVEYGKVGSTAQFLTLAQLNTLYAAGHDMCGHDTGNQVDVGAAQAETNARTCSAYLRSNGWHRAARYYVLPQGGHADWLEAILKRFFPKWRRRVTPTSNVAVPYLTDPVSPAVYYVTSTKSLATVKAYLDSVAASGHVAILVFHDIVNTISVPEDWLISDFQALVTYAHGLGMANATLSELYGS